MLIALTWNILEFQVFIIYGVILMVLGSIGGLRQIVVTGSQPKPTISTYKTLAQHLSVGLVCDDITLVGNQRV